MADQWDEFPDAPVGGTAVADPFDTFPDVPGTATGEADPFDVFPDAPAEASLAGGFNTALGLPELR